VSYRVGFKEQLMIGRCSGGALGVNPRRCRWRDGWPPKSDRLRRHLKSSEWKFSSPTTTVTRQKVSWPCTRRFGRFRGWRWRWWRRSTTTAPSPTRW